MRQRAMTAVVATTISWGLFGQDAPKRPSFEITSVKVNMTNGPSDFAPRRSGDRVTMHNAPVESMVSYAYHITGGYQVVWNAQIPEGGRWCDLEAIAPVTASEGDVRLMFQTMLEDRFHLKVHRETKELSSYDLVVGKGGSKLKTAEPDSKITVDGKPIRAGTGAVSGGEDGLHLVGKGASMEQLVGSLGGMLHAPVRDHTGLAGLFDYNVVFSRDDNPAELSSQPFLTTAIEEELGLKLEKSKGSFEVLVIDHIEKPSAN